jgi:membrane carboxypeptidase/penicillin-binding protein
MNDVLKDVFNYGTAGKARQLGFERAFAGKTGTTSNYRDAWFIGYSPRILNLVWIGFDDGHSVRLAGGDACVPIWTAHMNRIDGMVPDVDWKRPEDVIERQVDPESGMLATPYCPQSKGEIFVAGTEPTQVCPLHAGSGETSPLLRALQHAFTGNQAEDATEGSPQQQAQAQQPGQPPGQPQIQPQQPQQQQPKRERGIRRLLRAIFGGQ